MTSQRTRPVDPGRVLLRLKDFEIGGLVQIGDRVRIAKYQPGRIGVAEYPGRVGIIVRQNPFGKDRDGGLWYVALEPTKRARAREVCVFGKYLEPVQQPDPKRTAGANTRP